MQEDYHNIEEEDQQQQNNPIQPTHISNGQKIAVAFLAVFAIFAIGMWVTQFKNSITRPFEYTPAVNNNIAQNEEILLKNKDTDGDSLSDWDELNLYNTSPYLEDSDSDGINDMEEINNNEDPSCPAGRECYPTFISESESETEKEQNNLVLPNELEAQPENQGDTQNMLSGNIDANALRKILIEAGMEKTILDQFSDEDLLKSYQETLNK